MKVKEIGGLIELIAKSGLEEVNIETDQIKINVKRNPALVQEPATIPRPVGTPSTDAAAQESLSENSLATNNTPAPPNLVEIKSPLIGTFYRAADPDSPPFVQAGDKISQGQTLCVIEAMKLFNQIEAEIAGTVVQVLVEDASPVEYDQPLFLIAPT